MEERGHAAHGTSNRLSAMSKRGPLQAWASAVTVKLALMDKTRTIKGTPALQSVVEKDRVHWSHHQRDRDAV